MLIGFDHFGVVVARPREGDVVFRSKLPSDWYLVERELVASLLSFDRYVWQLTKPSPVVSLS